MFKDLEDKQLDIKDDLKEKILNEDLEAEQDDEVLNEEAYYDDYEEDEDYEDNYDYEENYTGYQKHNNHNQISLSGVGGGNTGGSQSTQRVSSYQPNEKMFTRYSARINVEKYDRSQD